MLIKKVNNKKNIHRSYKKILGVSVACLSLFATISMSGDVSHAASNLKPELIEAVEHVKVEKPVAPQPSSFVDTIKKESIKHLGVPYVYGGTTTRGFDCSGFTQYVFKSAGVNLPRTSGAQANIDKSGALAGSTTTISNRKNVKAGDLVFFSSGRRVSHVGIALDNNRYIHASSGRRAIAIAPRSGWYSSNFTKAIRINK